MTKDLTHLIKSEYTNKELQDFFFPGFGAQTVPDFGPLMLDRFQISLCDYPRYFFTNRTQHTLFYSPDCICLSLDRIYVITPKLEYLPHFKNWLVGYALRKRVVYLSGLHTAILTLENQDRNQSTLIANLFYRCRDKSFICNDSPHSVIIKSWSNSYYQSDEWKLLCKQVKQRDDFRCKVCNSDFKLQVHHRTYENFGGELLKDLTTLCKSCHEKFHNRRNNGLDKRSSSRSRRRAARALATVANAQLW